MKLSTIIVNWNTKDLLEMCLELIYGVQIDGGHEIFIVDNASTDGSQQMVEQQFPHTQLIKNSENLGFATANNQAMRSCNGEYILLLNSDTLVLPGALESMIEFMDVQLQAGACGARLLNPDRSLQPSCSPEPSLKTEFMRLFHLGGVRPDGYYAMEDWDTSAPRPVDIVLGAFLCIRRSVMQAVGFLDEDFFMYSEEVDYCRRVRALGWTIYWVPTSQVIHYGGQSTRQDATKMFLCLYQGKVKYFRKHNGSRSAIFYKGLLFFTALTRLAMLPMAWMGPSNQRESYLKGVNNYSRLLKSLPGL